MQMKIIGIFTDGDLRRTLDLGLDIHHTPIKDIMTSDCKVARKGMLAAEALQLMDKHKINALLVEDDSHQLVGALNMHDLLRAGVFYNRQMMFKRRTTRATLLDQHRAINAALQRRNPEAARAAIDTSSRSAKATSESSGTPSSR